MKAALILAVILVTVACSQAQSTSDSKTVNPPECGEHIPYNKSTNVDRILGGNFAKPGEFPSQVVVLYVGSINCGGSLINSQWILTAAHCVSGFIYSFITFRIGLVNWNEAGATVYRWSLIVPHPGYNSQDLSNDIALVKLNAPVTYTENIKPACLADWTITCDGVEGVAAGHGRTSVGGATSVALKYVEKPILSNSTCYSKYINVLSTYTTDKFVCAGEYGSDIGVCNGDSGGPLHVVRNNRHYECGLTSWGEICGDGGAFTRINLHWNWILTTLANN